MKKIELLSPVGDFECLKAAVQNGADSVYFGASNFSARASATNFDLEHLQEAITYAKLRGVHTHLTLNTLIKENEFEEAVNLASKAYTYGIDAIIVQDLGLANYLISHFPDLPIHASTQMTIHNLEGALEVENLGFKRAVLSRELSLSEIQYICHNTKIEIETFIHGALCISYSGQCLFSSMVGGRSGNRGKCAQPCRLPYTLMQKTTTQEMPIHQGYLLSTKDLCGLSFIPQLIQAGVICFKIEGRMKSPEYVATVTRIYRKYIDLALSSKPYEIDKQDKKALALVFNRGGFSDGHFNSSPNRNLIFPEKQNHMGLYLGNVSNIKANRGHVFINVADTLAIGDTIQFEKENTNYTVSELMVKGRNTSIVEEKELIEIGRMKGNIHIGDKVYKISSKELTNQAKFSYQGEHKKIKLNAYIKMELGKPIVLEVSTLHKQSDSLYQDIHACIMSKVVPVEATSKPITQERIQMQLNKTTESIFTFANIRIDLEPNLFLPCISVLNELRRTALQEIEQVIKSRISRKERTLSYTRPAISSTSSNPLFSSLPKTALLLNTLQEKEDYTILKNVDKLYIPLKFFSYKKYESLLTILCHQFSTYIYLPTIIKSNYKNILSNVIENSIERYHIKGFVLSNIASGIFLQEMLPQYGQKFEYISNYTLNVYNHESEQVLKQLGIQKITISPELSKQSILELCKDTSIKRELMVYGRIPLMSSNYCFLGQTNHCYPTCGTKCQEENSSYSLKDRLGYTFPILPDNIQTVSTIYNSKILSIDPHDFPVDSIRMDILEESIPQINSIIETILSSGKLEGSEFTNGNLNREV